MSAPVSDRTTSSTVWGLTGKRRSTSTAHAFDPQGDGWRSACGRYVKTQPAEAPGTVKLCGMCDQVMDGRWKTGKEFRLPEVARRD